MASVLPNKNEEKLLKIKQKLIEISSLSNDEIFVKFNSSKRGITDEEIKIYQENLRSIKINLKLFS